MSEWYAIFSFVTTPTSNPSDPTLTDLSAFFNTSGVAESFRRNTGWRLADAHYSSNAVNSMPGWSGTVSADGQLIPGSGTPTDLTFAETTDTARYMEIQVSFDPEPTAMCVSCDRSQVTASKSRLASAVSPYGVELATGRYLFDLPLLSVVAIGAGQWNFGLRYYPGFGISGITAPGFNYPQYDVLAQMATIGTGVGDAGGNDIELTSSGNTREIFSYNYATGGYDSYLNNTGAVLLRTSLGTVNDQFTLIAADGTISVFFGLYSGIATPGQLQSVTDRFGNTQTLAWTTTAGIVQLQSVTDSYGRTANYTYYGSEQGYKLQQITDFLGRQLTFQYDSGGRLVAVVTPAVSQAAPGNTFPGGTAYVFLYDTTNSRSDRQNDLIAVFYPNQTQPYLNTDTLAVDVASVYSSATPRYQISYGQDPTNVNTYGKVVSQTIGDPTDGVGGTASYAYTTTGLPTNIIDGSDPIVLRTTFTDCNGNQTYFDFDAGNSLSHKEVLANRNKNSLQASSWETWTSFNTHNQPLTTVMPEGNSIVNTFEDETNTIQFSGIPYARRVGLLKTVTRLPGNSIGIPSRSGSGPSGGVQNELIVRQFIDPLFGQTCASIEERGNPIDPTSGAYFPPQNGGTTPTDSDRSRYATINFFDYQKDSAATVQADTVLQAQLALTSTQIGALITFVNNQMTATDGTGGLPSGFQMTLGDINGDGTGNGTSFNARHQGALVEIQSPSVLQLIPYTGEGDPWEWQTQSRIQLFTNNARGQRTTATDPEGNVTAYVRYLECDPTGVGPINTALSGQQYGLLREVHVDADPNTVMDLVGASGDLVDFIGGIITRTNTPGVYQDLVTSYAYSADNNCASCGSGQKPTLTTDPRGYITTTLYNEVGQLYQTISAQPYNFLVQYYFDANGNTIRQDTENQIVELDDTDPTSPSFGQFTLASAHGTTAHLPMIPGPGGSVRPGWFTNLYQYNILDWKTEDDIDATGSTPSQWITQYEYDPNGNLATTIKPMGNTVEYDYDERDLRIAQRVGFDPTSSAFPNGAITVWSYDGNGNPLSTVGPAMRGNTVQTLVPSTAPTSGSFQLIFNGQMTATIAGVSGGTTAATIQTALYNLPNINNGTGTSNVQVTGSAGGPYTVTFVNALGQSLQPLLAVVNNTTNATTISVYYVSSSYTTSTASTSLSATLGDAFSGGTALTQTGDYLTANTYDGFDRLISATDALGNVAASTFDPGSRVIQVATNGPAGGTTPTDRTGANNVPLSSSSTNFDEAGRAYESQQSVFLNTGISGGSPTHNLPSGRSATHTGGGLATNSTTNSHTGTVTLTTGGTSYVLTRTVFDRSGRTTAVASDNTAITTYSYDGANNQILVTDPLGNTTATQYDANGNVVQVTMTQVSTFTTGGSMMMARAATADSESDSSVMTESTTNNFMIGADNNQTAIANQGANGTSDPCVLFTNPTNITNLPLGLLTWYSPTGTQITLTGNNSQGYQTVTICSTGNVAMTQPNALGLPTQTVEVIAQSDQSSGSSGSGSGSGGSAMSFVSSGHPMLASAVEPAAPAVPTTGPLAGGQTIRTTQTVYDANARIIAIIDARGAYTRYTYDLLDRLVTMTFQDGSTRTNVYNLAGDVIQYTDENGSVFTNTYDALGRKTAVAITRATSVVGTTAQTFQYDGLSRTTFARDSVSSTNTDASFAYDSLSRTVEEVQTYGDTRYITHDAWTSLTSTDLTYPSGRQITSGYDLLYRRNAINETSGGASIAAWQYTGSRIVECVLGNGLICTQLNNARTNSMVQSPDVPNPWWGDVSSDRLGYDGSGRMITKRFLSGGINGETGAYNDPTSLVGFTTFYDPSGNKLFERALHAEERSSLYSNDLLNRLLQYQRGVLATGGGSISTAITLPGTDSQRSYDLDTMDNWKNTTYTPVGGSATTEVRRHNLVNQINKFAATPVLYDHGNNAASANPIVAQRGNGNIANDGTRLNAYDALNRLTTVSSTSSGTPQVAAYTYDALGRRTLKVVTNGGIPSSITNATYRYLYDDQQIVEELLVGESTTTLRQFVWGQYIDELVQLKTYANTGTQPLAAGVYYLLQDLLYRTSALTNSSGNIVEAYDYDAYGNTLIYSGPGTDDTWFTDDDMTTFQPACEYLFTGRQYDPETEIYWYRARHYTPTLGRFLGRDDLGPYDSDNVYQYVKSTPAGYMDPYGLTQVAPLLLPNPSIQFSYEGRVNLEPSSFLYPDTEKLNPPPQTPYCSCKRSGNAVPLGGQNPMLKMGGCQFLEDIFSIKSISARGDCILPAPYLDPEGRLKPLRECPIDTCSFIEFYVCLPYYLDRPVENPWDILDNIRMRWHLLAATVDPGDDCVHFER